MLTPKKLLIATTLLGVAVGTALGQETRSDKYGLMAKPIEQPIFIKPMPLTDALMSGAMGMRSHYMQFGIELAGRDRLPHPPASPAQPMVSPPPAEQLRSVGGFLGEVFRQVPTYEYEVVSEHTVSIYPRGAKNDPDDVLNLRVPRFDVEGAYAGSILTFPDRFIPELRAKLFPEVPGGPQIHVYVGAVPPGPKVTLHVRDVTVREILNAVSVATEAVDGSGHDDYPCGWIFSPTSSTGEKQPYWGVFLSLPANWRDVVRGPGPPVAR